MTAPITPDQAHERRQQTLPAAIIDVFNELIARNYNGRTATVSQDEAADLIAERLSISRQQVFDLHYLDVESFYREAGWDVKYDSPGYADANFPPYFQFRRK